MSEPHDAAHAGGHASRSTYLTIALILGIVTVLEVAIFYVPVLHNVIVPVLLTLSAIKFTLVVMFFMHLKYDRPILTVLFAGGLVVAAVIIISLMALFGQFGGGAS